jgi:hypothetical protein
MVIELKLSNKITYKARIGQGILYMNGKLNGTILATTPTGLRVSWHVTPLLTSKVLPWINCGSEIAYSTVSLPLAISARASARFWWF